MNEVTLLIGVEGAQTPAGGRDRGDPQALAEEAPGPPAGKRSAWNGNQQDFLISNLLKNPCTKFPLCRGFQIDYFLFEKCSV
ncbi:hypothetical protein [Sutcliffiella horikoshii]|uniref:hypothetical protein n=1 Tax=Sutcliffiella horikoshii TaxID=79883 RepID=UPI001CFC9B1A|nr:hypothetical protein [Sutcliffiella horikoshii]